MVQISKHKSTYLSCFYDTYMFMTNESVVITTTSHLGAVVLFGLVLTGISFLFIYLSNLPSEYRAIPVFMLLVIFILSLIEDYRN